VDARDSSGQTALFRVCSTTAFRVHGPVVAALLEAKVEGGRQREGGMGERERECKRERESLTVCVCMGVCVYMCWWGGGGGRVRIFSADISTSEHELPC